MSTAELSVIYRADEEWTGEIVATVKSGAFSAQGSAWFDRTHVKKTFLANLRSFAPTLANPPTIEGGFWNGQGGLDQCHLRISIKPYNASGTLLAHVDLASAVWKTPDADLQKCASIRFLTEYAASTGLPVNSKGPERRGGTKLSCKGTRPEGSRVSWDSTRPRSTALRSGGPTRGRAGLSGSNF